MKYFTMSELTSSPTARRKGIDNTPNGVQRAALTALVTNILDPLREEYGKPIVVTSGFRCPRLNHAVGGVATSQHMKGEAADIRTLSDRPSDNKKLFDLIIKLGLPYDQCIDEYGYNWIHVSYTSQGNRRQILHIG